MKMLKFWFAACVSVCVFFLSGCSATAPNYQTSNDNIQALSAIPGQKVAVGAIEYGPKGHALNSLSIRGGSFNSPINDSWAAYVQGALESELTASGRFDANSTIKVSGTLLENDLDGASFSTGTAHISVRFVVERNGQKVYDQVVTVDNQWDSSMIGAVAIPAARRNYIATISVLIGKLFRDEEFERALR